VVSNYIHQVLLDPRTNWIWTFVNECYACTYYGHRLNYCPNISLDAGNLCARCWENRHDRDRDSFPKVNPPFREEYIPPTTMLTLLVDPKSFYNE
jgi:hypothetical protein